MSDLDKISSLFNAKIDSVKSTEDLQNIKTEFFGKNGHITSQFKNLGSLDPEKRKDFASNLLDMSACILSINSIAFGFSMIIYFCSIIIFEL